jgi:dethiobiotin synthetase
VSAIFITGTGTEVGKTFVAASLIRQLRSMGRSVEAIKPVVSGFDPEQLAASDPGVLLEALGFPTTLPNVERIAPWRFRAALSPDAAARVEDRRIDVDEVIAFCRSAIAQRQEILLIEGVGGIMVPLDDRHTVLDWMSALRLPVLLVAGSYLGTISHTLTALRVLAERNLTVVAVAVSESVTPGAPLEETVATIARFADMIEIVGVPRLEGEVHSHPAVARIASLIEDH